jgi:hypothetical protein
MRPPASVKNAKRRRNRATRSRLLMSRPRVRGVEFHSSRPRDAAPLNVRRRRRQRRRREPCSGVARSRFRTVSRTHRGTPPRSPIRSSARRCKHRRAKKWPGYNERWTWTSTTTTTTTTTTAAVVVVVVAMTTAPPGTSSTTYKSRERRSPRGVRSRNFHAVARGRRRKKPERELAAACLLLALNERASTKPRYESAAHFRTHRVLSLSRSPVEQCYR